MTTVEEQECEHPQSRVVWTERTTCGKLKETLECPVCGQQWKRVKQPE